MVKLKTHRAATGNSVEVLDAIRENFGLDLTYNLPTDSRALEMRLYLDPKKLTGQIRWTNTFKGEQVTWVESYIFMIDKATGKILPLTIDRMEEFTIARTVQWNSLNRAYHKARSWIKAQWALWKPFKAQ